jgi:hypothetical protein
MSKIGFHEAESFPYGLQLDLFVSGPFECFQLVIGLFGEDEFKRRLGHIEQMNLFYEPFLPSIALTLPEPLRVLKA